MMTTLLRLRRPFLAESLLGYLLRLTELNRYRNVRWLLEFAGLTKLYQDHSYLINDPHPLIGLAQLTDNPVDTITSMAYLPAQDASAANRNLSTFFGQPILRFALCLDGTRVCPQCLREDGYCHRLWELMVITVCPRHKCLLLENCPRCHQPISWYHRGLNTCRRIAKSSGQECGYDWREAQVEVQASVRVALEVSFLCGVKPHSPPSAPLASLNLQNYCLALSFLASLLDSQRKQISVTGRDFFRQPLPRLHTLLTQARGILDDWPLRFYDLLDRIRQASFQKGKQRALPRHSGLSKEFGNFYENLNLRYMKSPQLSFLREAFAEYQATRWDGGHKLNRIPTQQSSRYIGKKQAGQLLGSNDETIEKLLSEGILKGTIRRRTKGHLYLIEVESVLQYQLRKTATVGAIAIRRYLQINRTLLRNLVEAGFLERLTESEQSLFPVNTAENFLQRIRQRITPVGSRSKVNCLQVFYLLKNKRNASVHFLQTIFRGELAPCDETEDLGLAAFLFDYPQVVEYIAQQTATSQRTVEQLLKKNPVEIPWLLPHVANGRKRNRQNELLLHHRQQAKLTTNLT